MEKHGGSSSLDLLFSYYIEESYGNPIPFGPLEKFSLAIQIFGATAGVYAWPPAAKYSEHEEAWVRISMVAANPLSSVLFLAKATADFFTWLIQELTIPIDIKLVMLESSKKKLAAKFIKIIIGSAVCAIPFGILTYFFPLPGCLSKVCLGIIVTHSYLSNLIMHALSWRFILQPELWYYRLPILPFEKLYESLKWLRHSQSERARSSKRASIEAIYNKYRVILSKSIILAAERCVEDYIKDNQSCGYFMHNSFESFMKVNKDSKLPLRNCIMPFIKILGSLFMITAVLGWVVSPFYLASSVLKFGTTYSIAFGILPAYTTMVLASFFGSYFFSKMYSYFTSWTNCHWSSKLPLEGRLFPIPFILLTVVNMYVSAFAFANGVEYIENSNFDNRIWQIISPILVRVAIPALIILSFLPLQDLISAVIRGCVINFGADSNKKEACRLLSKATAFSERACQIKGPDLMNALNKYSPEQRVSFFQGISEDEFQRDVATLQNSELCPLLTN